MVVDKNVEHSLSYKPDFLAGNNLRNGQGFDKEIPSFINKSRHVDVCECSSTLD